MKTYIGPIISLAPNQIFVFGSNTQGRHGRGAALWAKNNAGAIYGIPAGHHGQSWAIVTKDLTKSVHPSVPKKVIVYQIRVLYGFAEDNKHLEFLIAYSTTRLLSRGSVPGCANVMTLTLVLGRLPYSVESVL